MELIQGKHPRLGYVPVWHINAHGTALCGDTIEDERKTVASLPRGCHICRDCAAAHHQFTIETIRSGQVRRYGPTERIYMVTDLADEKRSADEVETFCREHVYPAYRPTDPNDHPKDSAWPAFRSTIKGFSQTSPGVWRYFVFEESTH